MQIILYRHPQSRDLHAYATARTLFIRQMLRSSPHPNAADPLLIHAGGHPAVLLPGPELTHLNTPSGRASYAYAEHDIHHHLPGTLLRKVTLGHPQNLPTEADLTVTLSPPDAEQDARDHLSRHLLPAVYHPTPAGLLIITPGLHPPTWRHHCWTAEQAGGA